MLIEEIDFFLNSSINCFSLNGSKKLIASVSGFIFAISSNDNLFRLHMMLADFSPSSLDTIFIEFSSINFSNKASCRFIFSWIDKFMFFFKNFCAVSPVRENLVSLSCSLGKKMFMR